MRPMLAQKIDENDISNLNYPILVSAKMDGVRCLLHPDKGALSRNLKPIPNINIQNYIKKMYQADYILDGELWSPSSSFNEIQSIVMSKNKPRGMIDFYCFDFVSHDKFSNRLKKLSQLNLNLIKQYNCKDSIDFKRYFQDFISNNYEGIVIKDPDGRYKFGRSTKKEGLFLKYKSIVFNKATIIDIIPMTMNFNDPKINNLGLTERSTKKQGLRNISMIGSFKVKYNNQELLIGSGLSDDQRLSLWKNRNDLIGQEVIFKYQKSIGNKPRFPIFVEFNWREYYGF